MLYCFDQQYAHIAGLHIKILYFSLLALLSLTIVSALKAAGIILVIAMLIAPGAIAHLLTHSFDRMLIIAISVSLISCFIGTITSYHLDVATAPMIVVIQASLFVAVFMRTLILQTKRKKDRYA